MQNQKTLKIIVQLKSFHPIYLDNFVIGTKKQLKNFSLSYADHVFLPTKIERYTVLRSPHVDKKARDQFERKTHKRLLSINIPFRTEQSFFLIYRILRMLQTQAIGLELRLTYYIDSELKLSKVHAAKN